MEHINLITDTRERVISQELTKLIKYSVKQLDVGDFIIEKNNKHCAIIERKTIKDYADSMYDGRINNYFNMLNYRNTYGCDIIFFIEGYQDMTFRAHGYTYIDLLKHMINIQFTHNIIFINTANSILTANHIVELCNHYAYHNPIDGFIGGEQSPNISESTSCDSSDTSDTSDISDPRTEQNNETNDLSLLVSWKAVLTDVDDNTLIGIARKISFADWIYGTANNFKYKNILLEYIEHPQIGKLLKTPSKEDSINLLASIKGVSRKTATEVVESTTLLSLLLNPNTKCSLGKVRKEKVIKILKSVLE